MSAPDKAFILAAGYGTRMRPLTLETPKPMLKICDQPLLGHALAGLEKAGVKEVVINTHYKGEQIAKYVRTADFDLKINLAPEDPILDTGGGIANAIGSFNAQPFYVLSGDGLWVDDPCAPALDTLAGQWDPAKMDILILLQPIDTMALTKGIGDYDLEPDGRAVRSADKTGAYMFTSMRINHPRIFHDKPQGRAFSYLDLLDEAEHKCRLYGVVHTGEWYHLSTPEDLARVNASWQGEREQQ